VAASPYPINWPSVAPAPRWTWPYSVRVRVVTCLFFAFATMCLAFLAAVPGGLILAGVFGNSGSAVQWGALVIWVGVVFAVAFLASAFYYAWTIGAPRDGG
jgi:hypothetical protein